MRRELRMLAACLAVAVMAVETSADVTDAQVRHAMQQAVEFLYSQQNAAGHWDDETPGSDRDQYAGYTALVCYALLSAGEQWQDNPRLQQPLKFLTQAKIRGTYAVGFRAHVWPKLPNEFMPQLRRDAILLTENLNRAGAYRYVLGEGNDWDNSCTQYGVLGVWECAKRGFNVPTNYWKAVEDHILDEQNDDGGWGYRGTSSTLAMTSAGLAILYITQDYLHADDYKRVGLRDSHRLARRLALGLDYLDTTFEPTLDGYEMLGVERVGLASGRKFFNRQDWYRQVSEKLLEAQSDDGAIGEYTDIASVSDQQSKLINTAFALVFLSRGRVPVMANKLEIPGYAWNNRPRDLANATRWVSDEFEIPMNWQIVDVDSPVEDWLDAPLLYLASHEALKLDGAQMARIKRFIDLGGTLVTVADAGRNTFSSSLVREFERLYPYEFKAVPPDDALFNIVFPLRHQRLVSLHNGVRHLVILLPNGDPGLAWQLNDQHNSSNWQLMGNIFQYAIEKSQPRARLQRHFVSKRSFPLRFAHVGRARYDGNWNPEPLAWERLDVFTSNQNIMQIDVHDIDLADIADADISLVHVVGTSAVDFTPQQVQAVRRFVESGGVVLFEAVGGGPQFTQSVLAMLAETYPDRPLQRIPSDSAVISGRGVDDAMDCRQIGFRLFHTQRLGAQTQPALQAVMFDGQPRLIVSAEDLSFALLDRPVWGVFGYDADSARRLMTNIVLWARQIRPASGQNLP